MTRRAAMQTHLDEIASLLAMGYVRLQRKRAAVNTYGQLSSENGDSSLDSIWQAERSCAGHKSLLQEDADGYLA